HGDVVAVGQHGLVDRYVVDTGGVGRAQVADAAFIALEPDLAVLARDALVGDAQVRLLRAAHQHARIADVRARTQAFTVDHDHARRARRCDMRAVAGQGALRGFEGVVACVHV